MGVRSLGYVRLASTDLPAWKVFGGDFLGMMPVDGADPDSLHFRIDHYPPRLVVEPGAENRMTAMGFEVLDKRELAMLVAAVENAGIKVTPGEPEACAARRVTGFVAFDDPGGNPVELFYGPILDHVPVQTPLVSSFVAGDLGMGHVIVSAEDAEATLDFYIDVLGFVERNTMGRTWFLGCNPRHHTFGIARRRGPGALLHLMVEGATLDDVGLALDRAAESRRADDELAGQAHERPDGVVLRLFAGELRHRVRLERPAGHRGAPDLRDHPGRLLGPQVHPTPAADTSAG